MDKTPKTPSKTAKPSPATQVKDKAQAPKRTIDWESVELQYRAGIRSLKDIGSEFGVSDAGIIKRAKRDGWERDLRAKIQAKAEAKVSASLVSAEVSAQAKINERVIVEVNAQAVAEVRLAHRKDASRARILTNRLFDELEKQTDPANLALLEDLGEMLRREDPKGQDKLNDLYQKVIGLSERSKTMKVLADTFRVLVDIERTAFGMDINEKPPETNPVESLLLKIATASTSAFKPSSSDPERFQNPEINGFMPKSLK